MALNLNEGLIRNTLEMNRKFRMDPFISLEFGLFGPMILGYTLFCSRDLFAEPHRGLSKEEAFSLLKSNGYQWKQTELLGHEAEAKSEQAKSAFLPHIRLNLREYLTRNNPVQYGISEFLNVQRVKKKMEMIDANIERDSEIFRVAESRVQVGLGTRLDFMRAKGL